MANNIEELRCPITKDFLEDPINLPCCGRAISRQAMIECKQNFSTCPLCKQDLDMFNPDTAPKAVNIAYMVEHAKTNGLTLPEVQESKPLNVKSTDVKLKAKLHCLCNNYSSNVYKHQTVIGKLTITSEKNNLNFKTLLIPVVDRSGSMSGSPILQCHYSLNRMIDLTYMSKHLITNIISYDDRAESILLNTDSYSAEHYRNQVSKIGARGGTSFYCAFEEIFKICDKYKDVSEVSSIVILLLTDGQDGAARGQIENWKQKIRTMTSKQVTIHTIGFGNGHDFELLNNIRMIGNIEGAYRFADPNEDNDSLSNKINSIVDVISKSMVIPLEISDPGKFTLIGNGYNSTDFWFNLTKVNLVEPHSVYVSINNEFPSEVPVEIDEDQNDYKIWNEWYKYSIDKIASEIIELCDKDNTKLEFTLHCDIIEQRGKIILTKLDSTHSDALRLENLLNATKALRSGQKIDKLKLNDMKFEGQYTTNTATQNVPKQTANVNTFSQHIASSHYVPIKKVWITYDKKSVKYDDFTLLSEFKEIILNNRYDPAFSWIQNNFNNLNDNDKKESVILSSKIGKYKRLEIILNLGKFTEHDLTYTNVNGYNALDLAIINGYWTTAELLIKHGTKPLKDGDTLLRTCLSYNYVNTASLLIKYNIVVVTDDLIENCSNMQHVQWLTLRKPIEVTLEEAILKGLYDKVEEKINNDPSVKISISTIFDIFVKPTIDHINIVDLLLRCKTIDPYEIMTKEEYDEKEKTNIVTKNWPLFETCERGNLQMFNILIKYITDTEGNVDVNFLNTQNHKGTTCLWIACCNKRIDIVGELLNMKVDVNIPNIKGDNALIPCCQKGYETITEMLIESGISFTNANKNGDFPILIACRCGQSRILEMLLKKLEPDADALHKALITYAYIDGFNPLLAATELDKVECIKVLHKYGADLEYRTGADNEIISGATAVHLAAFYGRLSALATLHNLGCDMITQTTTKGWTVLHIAIIKGNVNVVRYLMSIDAGKQCLEIVDNDNRLPSYYANIVGNESILEEFFTNKLTNILTKVLLSDEETEKKCAEVLMKYGRSLGCYEYENITDIDILNNGSTMLTYSMLNGNSHMTNTLLQMGARLDRPDDFGITPLFWSQYLGYDTTLMLDCPDDIAQQVSKQLETVQQLGKTNMQNKILLGLQPTKLELISNSGETNNLIKMTDGYDDKIKFTIIKDLQKSLKLDYSLLGFVDKLKSSKVFPDGETQLKYIMADAKINIIKRVASGEKILQPVHMLALYMYTSNYTIFKNVNQILKEWSVGQNTSNIQSNIWHPFINCLYQAINLLPPQIGEVYRAVNTKFDVEKYAIGKEIQWNGFSLCSTEWKDASDLINNKTGIVFIIKSKTGRNISKYSKYPVDGEVIFLPASKFTITAHYVADKICLAQANIRNSTFKIKESDYTKALEGKSSIIIELTETEK